MTGSESLLGGFWFLISLFWASIISLLFLNMGGGNSNSFSNNILALHTCRITADVRGTDFIGYSVLHERLYLS